MISVSKATADRCGEAVRGIHRRFVGASSGIDLHLDGD